MCERFKDKVVVITGAAQGLGEALAIRLSDEGAKVLVADRNEGAAWETAAQLKDAVTGKVNVASYKDCEAMAQAAIDKCGRIDMLFANAAIFISDSIEDMTAQQFAKVVDVNQEGFGQELRVRGEQVWRRRANR